MQFFTALLISATAALVAAAPAPVPAEAEPVWGPTQFCVTLSRGGGPPTCIDVPEGCFVIPPGFNTIPPVQCGDTEQNN